MSINFGYTADSSTEDLEDLKTKLEALTLKSANVKKAVVALSTQVNLTFSYKTIFELNVKTATADLYRGVRSIRSPSGDSQLSQSSSWKRPTYTGGDFIENSADKFLHFFCHELMYPDISIFIILSVTTTAVSGTWAYAIGNDNGSYDKFIGYSRNKTNELCWGGSYNVKANTCTLPSTVDITTKHLISCHWLMYNACLWCNGVRIPYSSFKTYMVKTGEPFGSIFYNNRLPSSSSASDAILKGKLYGLKIVKGSITPEDISKIHTELIAEHNITTT